MPRTKRPVSKPKAPRLPDSEEAARRKRLDEICRQPTLGHVKSNPPVLFRTKKNRQRNFEQMQMLDQRCEATIKDMQMAHKILISSLTKETLNKTIGQLRTEYKEMAQSNGSRRAVSQDDGYLTEGSHQEDTARSRLRVSRSATRHADVSAASTDSRRTTTHRSRSAARPQRPHAFKTPASYRTPAIYKTPSYTGPATNFPPITPKVVPNTPMTILRRPRQGEMVVSMSGSPLMVTTMQPDNKANCNIPLEDGTVLCMQPEHLRKSTVHIPYTLLHNSMLNQLETLKQNLETVVMLGEKKKKKIV